MNYETTDAAQAQVYCGNSPTPLGRTPLKDRLTQRKRNIARELEQIDEALALLEKNPDVLRLMDLVGNIGY